MGRGKTPPGAGVGFALAELRAARANMNTKRAAGALPLGSKAEMETSWQEEVQAALLREKLLQEKLDALEAKDAGSMPPSRRNSSKSSCPGTPAGEQEKWKQEKTMLTMEVARLERLVEDEKELASQKEKMQQEKSARLEEALKDLEQKMLERTKAEGSELETRLAEAEAKASAKEREVADLQSSVQALSNESDQLRRDLAESRAQLEETHKAKTDLAVLSEDQRCQLESMQEEMESSQSKARVLEKLKEDAETKLMEHELKVQDLEAKLQDAEAAAMAKVPVEPVVREVVREVQRDSAGEELHREVRLAKARVAELEAQHADQLASMELRQETLAAQVTMLQQQLDLARRDRKTRMAGLLNSRRTAGAPEQTDAAQPPAAPSAGGTTQTFNTPAVGASSLFAQPSTTKDASALFGPGPTVPPAQVAEQTDAVASSAPAAASARGTADPFQPPAAVDTSSWFDEEPSTTKDASALFGPGPTVPPAQAAEQTDAVASSATAAASARGTTDPFKPPAAVDTSSCFDEGPSTTTQDASALFGPGPTVPPAQAAEQTDAVASSAPVTSQATGGVTDPFKPPAAVDTSSWFNQGTATQDTSGLFDEGPSTTQDASGLFDEGPGTTQDASGLFGAGPTTPPVQAEQTDVASSAPVAATAAGVTDPFKPPAAVDTSSWFNQGTATQDTSGLFDEGPSTTQDASGLFDEGPGTTQDASGLFGAGPTTPPVQAEQTDVASSAPAAATAAGVTDPFKPPAAVDTSSWFNQGTATQDTSGFFDEGPSTTHDASGLFDEGPGTTQDASGLFGAGPTTPPVQAEQTDVASSAPAAATAAGVTDPFKPPAAVDTSSWFNQGTATQDTSGFFDEGPSTTHDASGLFDEGPGTTQDASGLFGAGPTTPPVQAEQTDVASSAPAAATAAGVTDPFKPPAAVDTSSWFNQGTATQDTSGFFDEGPSTTHDASGLFDEGPGTTQDASGLFGAGPTTPPVQAEQTDVASSAPAAATAAGTTDPFKPPAAADTSSWFDQGPSTALDASGFFDEGPSTATQDASGLFGPSPTMPPAQATEQTDGAASSAPAAATAQGTTDPFKPPAAADTSSWFDQGPSTAQDASGFFDEGPSTATQDASGLFGPSPTMPPAQATEQTDGAASSAPAAATAQGMADPFKPPAAVDTSSWFNQGTATQDTSGLFDEGPSTTQDASGLFDEGPSTATQDASGLFGPSPTTPPAQAEQTDGAFSSAPAPATAGGAADPFKAAAVDTSSWFDQGPSTTQDASGLFGAADASQVDETGAGLFASVAASGAASFTAPLDTSSWFDDAGAGSVFGAPAVPNGAGPFGQAGAGNSHDFFGSSAATGGGSGSNDVSALF
ncbi:unnamed protein product [Effrenium voratum]|uniref:Uncharacterized protein n=1 Tax=Effrenium voratum TaxID=2562239 RepID=A0AA36ID18_9DINO|nr:unnamed protein product [Effrenium voratum]